MADQHILEVVAADLGYLRSEWDQSVDDHSLRRSSPVLRRLLVHNDLQAAWRMAGFPNEPRFRIPSLDACMQGIPRDRIVLASAGGATYNGGRISHMLMVDYDMTDEELANAPTDSDVVVGLRAFGEMPCLIVFGQSVPRRVLIKYVANKLGGDHFDPSRTGTEEDCLFASLDEVRTRVFLLEKSCIYFELLAAGQAVVQSPDIARFLEAVRV